MHTAIFCRVLCRSALLVERPTCGTSDVNRKLTIKIQGAVDPATAICPSPQSSCPTPPATTFASAASPYPDRTAASEPRLRHHRSGEGRQAGRCGGQTGGRAEGQLPGRRRSPAPLGGADVWTTTRELLRLVAWLTAAGCTHVALGVDGGPRELRDVVRYHKRLRGSCPRCEPRPESPGDGEH